MQFEIPIDDLGSPMFYDEFCRFIYNKMKKDLNVLVSKNSKHYKVREQSVLDSSLISWINKPDKINLIYYVRNCLTLEYHKGKYVISINRHWLIKGSRTPVIKLIRMLEYGTDSIPEYPLLRYLFRYYSQNYSIFLGEFIERTMMVH